MKELKFTAEQIAFALRQEKAGTPFEDICSNLGKSQATFYRWKKCFGYMGVAELCRLRQLLEQNCKLKHPCCRRRFADA